MIRLDDDKFPIPVGITGGTDFQTGSPECYVTKGTIKVDPDPDPSNSSHQCPIQTTSNAPQTESTSLWFVTNNGGTRNYGYNYPLWFYNPRSADIPVTLRESIPAKPNPQQPLLIPVLQLHATDNASTTAANAIFPVGARLLGVPNQPQSRWLIPAKAGTTTYNLVLGSGNGPSRPNESNGGLENFPRLLENWLSGTKGTRGTVQILGSFIQIRRSRYATAPAIPLQLKTGSTNNDLVTAPAMFGVASTDFSDAYNSNNVDRRVSYYTASNRNWGFDVGILSQPPDLFAQKFTAPSTEPPDNYFREVSRDDEWVRELLCSKLADPNDPTKATTTNAVPNSIRPSNCLVKP
jgi:hypothetical protein